MKLSKANIRLQHTQVGAHCNHDISSKQHWCSLVSQPNEYTHSLPTKKSPQYSTLPYRQISSWKSPQRYMFYNAHLQLFQLHPYFFHPYCPPKLLPSIDTIRSSNLQLQAHQQLPTHLPFSQLRLHCFHLYCSSKLPLSRETLHPSKFQLQTHQKLLVHSTEGWTLHTMYELTSRGGHSLFNSRVHMRSRPICRGAIYLEEKIIRHGIFQNKGECLYFNTPYQSL